MLRFVSTILACLLTAAAACAQPVRTIPGTHIKIPRPKPERPTYEHGMPVVFFNIAFSTNDSTVRNISDDWGILLSGGYQNSNWTDRVQRYIDKGLTNFHVQGPYGGLPPAPAAPPNEYTSYMFNQYELAENNEVLYGGANLANLLVKQDYRDFQAWILQRNCTLVTHIDAYQSVNVGAPLNEDYRNTPWATPGLRDWAYSQFSHLVDSHSPYIRMAWGAASFTNNSPLTTNGGPLDMIQESAAVYGFIPIVEAITEDTDPQLSYWNKFDQQIRESTFETRHLDPDYVDGNGRTYPEIHESTFPVGVNIFLTYAYNDVTDIDDLRSNWQSIVATVEAAGDIRLVPLVSWQRLDEIIDRGANLDLDEAAFPAADLTGALADLPLDDNIATPDPNATTLSADAGNDGSISGSSGDTATMSATGPTGTANTALQFNGTDDQGSATLTGTLTYPFTIGCYVKRDNLTGEVPLMSITDADNGLRYFDVRSADSTGLLKVVRRNTTQYIRNTTQSLDTNWHHVAVVFVDNDTFRFYLDGAYIETWGGINAQTALDQVDIDANFDSVAIGVSRLTLSTGYFDGAISMVRVYNSALNENDIAAWYALGQP